MSIRRFYNIVSIDEALELLQLNMKEYFIYEIYNWIFIIFIIKNLI